MRKYPQQRGIKDSQPRHSAKVHVTARVRSQHMMERPFVNTVRDKYLVHLDFKEIGEKYFPGLYVAASQMNVGERAKFIIPPELGYGGDGRGNEIPPNSWIVADIWLIEGDGRRMIGTPNYE